MEKILCPDCGKKAKLIDSIEVYHTRSYGWAYICYCSTSDPSYVGCHKGTKTPLGRLANRELRSWKVSAHRAFDLIWKKGFKTRSQAYEWLAEQLDIPRGDCHIGLFDITTCKKVYRLSRHYLENKK